MAKRIPLSFKENPRDQRLYKEVKSKGDQSAFVKEALEFYIEHIDSKATVTKAKDEVPGVMEFENDDEGIGEIMGFD